MQSTSIIVANDVHTRPVEIRHFQQVMGNLCCIIFSAWLRGRQTEINAVQLVDDPLYPLSGCHPLDSRSPSRLLNTWSHRRSLLIFLSNVSTPSERPCDGLEAPTTVGCGKTFPATPAGPSCASNSHTWTLIKWHTNGEN